MSDATDCSIFYTPLSLKGRSSNPERFDTTVKFTISCDWWLNENIVWPAFLIYFSFLISDNARHWFFSPLLGKQSPTISTIVTLAESLLSSIYWHFVEMKNSTARSCNPKTFLTMKKMTWGATVLLMSSDLESASRRGHNFSSEAEYFPPPTP